MACGILLLFCAASFGAFQPQEICVIRWGDGPGELKIAGPSIEFNHYPPRDSGEEYMNSVGPDVAFVDRFENLYFGSSYFLQLKCFNHGGSLRFDYSMDQPTYNPQFYRDSIAQIYVDSVRRLYVFDGHSDHIPVLNQEGKIVEEISPPGLEPGQIIYGAVFNRDRKLTLYFGQDQCASYSNGSYSENCSIGRLGNDDFYYLACYEMNSGVINFFRTDVPISHWPERRNRTSFYYDKEISYAEFLGVDDNLQTFILCFHPVSFERRVLVFDRGFTLQDHITLPYSVNKYRLSITPYMRPSDGNIYEFRCLDDGLHVIRWSRQ